MKRVLFLAGVILIAGCATQLAGAQSKMPLSGVYDNGAGTEITLTIDANGLVDLKGRGTSNGDEWESRGYYSSKCDCIRAIFRYINKKDSYPDPGFQDLRFRAPGNAFNYSGGWTNATEFGQSVFVRKP